MFGIHDFGIFLDAGILLNLTPGPDTVYIWVELLRKVAKPEPHPRSEFVSEVFSTPVPRRSDCQQFSRPRRSRLAR